MIHTLPKVCIVYDVTYHVHKLVNAVHTVCLKIFCVSLTKEPGACIMVRVWYFDGLPGDQRLPHKLAGGQEVTLEKLAELGILYWEVKHLLSKVTNHCTMVGLLIIIWIDPMHCMYGT